MIDAPPRGDPDKSYVARLFSKGTDAILKKIGEEATEVVMAAKDGDRAKLVNEMADLWFHSMIALAAFGLRRPTCWPSWSAAKACRGWRNSPRARPTRTGPGGSHERQSSRCLPTPSASARCATIGHISYVLHPIVAVGAVLPGFAGQRAAAGRRLRPRPGEEDDAAGTWQESHFRWRIRSVLWAAVLYLVTLPLWLLFFVPGWIAWGIISIWFLYRVVRGWLT